MDAEKKIVDLTKSSNGGGGGGTSDYTDLSNKPKINNVTLSGNKTSAQLGLVGDVQIDGTSVTTDGVANVPVANTNNLGVVKLNTSYGLNTNSAGTLIGVTRTESTYGTADSLMVVCKGTLTNIQNTYVRSVSPACTILSGTTATITANSTYANTVDSSGCVYTISTPTDLTAYNGFILMLDTTNSASIAFQTDGSPATSITISGNPTIETGKTYTVVGQYNVLSSAWNLWISEYKGA